MSEDQQLLVVQRYVHADHVVDIHVNDFVAHNQLFQALLVVAQDENVGVSNVKLILPLDQKLFLSVVLRFVFVYLEDEETEFLLVLVGQNEIGLLFLLVDDFLDSGYIVLFVNVDLLLRFDVQVEAVVW